MTYSPKKLTLPILSQLTVEIEVAENPYNWEVTDLFQMAARINKKRSFLFVSKILGKHIPIDPKKGLQTGALLAQRYINKRALTHHSDGGQAPDGLTHHSNGGQAPDRLKQQSDEEMFAPFVSEKVNPVIIGFAETATALGHAFFHCFKKADYFHTTREILVDRDPVITFEEEHSHATSHRCYVDEAMLNNDREIILVDDELTTGKTAINIIRSIHNRFPRKTYTVVSILDWRSGENMQIFADLEKELGVDIHSVSLLKGKINVTGDLKAVNKKEINESQLETQQNIKTINIQDVFPGMLAQVDSSSSTLAGAIKNTPYLKGTGRFSMSANDNESLTQSLKEIGHFLQNKRIGEKTLCLGTGEFMYIPMKAASMMGDGVFYQSTTRSPIYVNNIEGYGAKYGLAFPNPEDFDIAHFVYNIPPNEYDDVFVFFERAVSENELKPLLNELGKTNIKNINIVFFNGGA